MTIITNIIIKDSSLSGANFKESIDLALVCAAFDQTVNLIFVDFGIYNLIKGQSSAQLNDKTQVKILHGLTFYDVDKLFVEKESLEASKILKDHLLPTVQVLTAQEICALNLSADHLVVL